MDKFAENKFPSHLPIEGAEQVDSGPDRLDDIVRDAARKTWARPQEGSGHQCAARGALEQAIEKYSCQRHKPLRLPMCNHCQLAARIEEALQPCPAPQSSLTREQANRIAYETLKSCPPIDSVDRKNLWDELINKFAGALVAVAGSEDTRLKQIEDATQETRMRDWSGHVMIEGQQEGMRQSLAESRLAELCRQLFPVRAGHRERGAQMSEWDDFRGNDEPIPTKNDEICRLKSELAAVACKLGLGTPDFPDSEYRAAEIITAIGELQEARERAEKSLDATKRAYGNHDEYIEELTMGCNTANDLLRRALYDAGANCGCLTYATQVAISAHLNPPQSDGTVTVGRTEDEEFDEDVSPEH